MAYQESEDRWCPSHRIRPRSAPCRGADPRAGLQCLGIAPLPSHLPKWRAPTANSTTTRRRSVVGDVVSPPKGRRPLGGGLVSGVAFDRWCAARNGSPLLYSRGHASICIKVLQINQRRQA